MEIAGTAAGIGRIVALENTRDGRETLRKVFDECGDALYRFIQVRVQGSRDTADDLLQQTCYEAARHRRPPVDPGECEAWLRGIARNLIRRHWRRAKRQAGLVPLEDPAVAGQLADDLESRPLPDDALIKDESVAQLLLAVTSLPAADQSLIAAYYFEGRSQAEIARTVELTEKSIETRLYRVRGRLRAALQKMERPGEP